jgi:cystathionine beta-lyase/cystathionine gamma-synthase
MQNDIDYILNFLGEHEDALHRSVSPPIFQTTNFGFKTVAHLRYALAHESSIPFYTRGTNPTLQLLAQKLAALEQAEAALLFSSGSAAIAAAVLANVQQGDHIVSVQKPYSWSGKLMSNLLARFGVTVTYVDGTQVENFAKAIQPNTRLFFLESPNSLTFELQDIAAVSALAKTHGLLTVVDNSCAGPLYQNPIALGADLVMHSATKYIAGHSDAVAGVVCGTQAMIDKIFASEYMTLGGILSPFNAWLLLRGLRTLPLRMAKSAENARKVMAFLDSEPLVTKIYHPFHPKHPQRDLAFRQMKDAGGLFAFELSQELSIAQIEQFCNTLQRFILAVSWGGYESLILPVCALSHSANYQKSTVSPNIIRIYTGVEDATRLIEDLKQGFCAIKG